MNPFKNEQKEQIISWVQKLRNTTTHVLISDFCYECILTGVHKTKTLIVIPEMLEKEGIIAIDKPI